MVVPLLSGPGEAVRILFLSDNFPPEVNAPASRTYEHCRHWAGKGHQVTVVTCAPNFPKGKVFDGYRNALWAVEHIEGIRVVRVWSYITANEGFFRRVIDHVSFMVSGVVASVFVGRQDVVIATSPQFFAACAGWVAAVLKRRSFIFELRDIWPESIKAVGVMGDSWILRVLEGLEMFLYRRATRIVAVTHSFRRTLIARGIDGGKIDVVTNGVDLSQFSPRPKDEELVRELGLSGCFVAGYIGTHGLAHGLDTLLDAAAILQEHDGGMPFRLLFMGDGAAKAELKARAQAMGLKNTLFLDSVPKSEVSRCWSLLDASVVHLRKTELFSTVIPSKLFECMGMGIPVLLGVRGEAEEIVEREDIGAVFEPEDASALAALIIESMTHQDRLSRWGRNSLAAARKYDRSVLADVMLEKIEREVR